MGNRIRSINVAVKADVSDFEKKMKKAASQMQDFGQKMTAAGRAMTMAITVPIMAVSTAAIKMASDAQESEQLFTVAMEGMANSARKWSEQLSTALGINAYEIRKNVGTFDVMLKSMGLNEQAAYDMSKGLTQLTYDIASLYNITTESAFDKLQSAIVGMPRPLQDLGIVANDTAVKTWALANGIIKQGEEMTEAQEVASRYALIMERTSAAQGDLARTMESPVNKMRVLKSQIEETAIELGNALLPTFNKLLDIGKKVVEFVRGLVDKFNALPEGVQNTIIAVVGFVAALGPAIWMIGQLSTGVSAIMKILPMMSSPIGMIAAGLAAIVGAYIIAYNSDADFRKQADRTWSEVKQLIQENKEELELMGGVLQTGILFIIENIARAFMDVIRAASRLTDAMFKITKGDFLGAAKSFGDALIRTPLESAIEQATLLKRMAEESAAKMNKGNSRVSGAPRGGDVVEENADITKYVTDLEKLFKGLANGMDDSSEKAKKFTDKVKEMVSAIRSQTRAFADFTGIFDVFQRQSISGERLLNRMKAQVSAMGEWQQSISSLEQRDINKNLLEQVRAMGPQAVDQVKALAAMTDTQLAEYNKLYSQRYGIAGEQAQKVVARESQIETLIEKQEINIKVESGDARKIANDIVRELRLAGVSI